MHNDIIQKIEEVFKVLEGVADKIKISAEKVRGGYIIYESRPRWNNPKEEWTKMSIAKLVFHNQLQKWKVYWMRASGRWEYYDERKTLSGALKIVNEDKYGCFFG